MRKRFLFVFLILGFGCSSPAQPSSTSGRGGGSGGTGPGAGGSGGSGGSGASTGGSSATGGSGTGGGSGSGGSTGTTGAGGRAVTGSGGNSGSGSGGTGGASSAGASVLERNNHPSRDGHFVQPALGKTAAGKMAQDTSFNAAYTGSVLGSPLYFSSGPGGQGIFVVVTSGNDVYALDETTGATVWTKNLGMPAGKSGASGGCDGIQPLGVISTPVIDGRTGTLYVAGAIGDANGITSHSVWALSLQDGSIKSGYPVDVSKALGFPPTTHNQRGALSLVGNILYVPYGGHTGDCVVDMHGRVVAIDTSANPPVVKGWQSAGQGEAIWAPAGMASAGDGVFATTGNRFTTTGDHNDSEEVAHVRGMGTLDKGTGSKDFFFPSDWKTKDQRDFDMGAVNPVLVTLPGSTGPALIVTSKDGNGFILDSADLSKGPLATFDVTMQGMNVRSVPTAYVSGSTVFYAIAVDSAWANCPNGTANGSVLMAFALSPSLPLKPAVAWCATYGLVPKGTDEVTFWGGPGAPGLIATTTDGTNDALVWYMDGGKQLVALDGATGATVFRDTAASCGSVRKWTSPIAVKGRIVVAADGKLCSWSPH
ncbi:MAG TPA: PQQ-binding-like beta-propeller repeat protein [Polyangia bacterium]|nr:PQQ-binding-like beta-propeller repeat protein [Polyangia bacterium]